MRFTYPLPDHILHKIDPTERHKLGKGFETMNEIQARVDARSEKKLHAEIRQLLNRKGIVFYESRMDRRSHGTVGWPDFTFSVTIMRPSKADPTAKTCVPIPCAWECKVGNAKLRIDQEVLLRTMQTFPNSWRVKVIHSLKEAADELKALGI